MSADDVVQRIGGFTGRRKFLARIGAATMSAAFVVLGLADRAEAVRYGCCNLCAWPTSSCCGGRTPRCTWSWTCCHAGQVRYTRYRCIECYCTGSACSDCPSDVTSRAVVLGEC